MLNRMKDIFIDTNIASRFSNPLDLEYKKLVKWLTNYVENSTTNAYLVVSNKLLNEYYRSSQNACSATSIPTIINQLTREGRLIKISNRAITEFQKQFFTKKVISKLTCNSQDREHIPVVLLSNRKYVLAIDNNFLYDLVNFPGFVVTAAKRPQNLPYSQ